MTDRETMNSESNRKAGRPIKADGPALESDEIDRLLVHGEPKLDDDGQAIGIHYPSYRELGERFNVAHSLVAKYSKHHNCMTRRKQAMKRAQEISDDKLIELRADQIAISRDDQIRIVDRFLVAFEQALVENRVRCDNPSDYNLMCRLRSFLTGEADSRHEQWDCSGLPTLEELQKRHKKMLEEYEKATPKERGELAVHLYGFDGVARNRVGDGEEDASDAGEDSGVESEEEVEPGTELDPTPEPEDDHEDEYDPEFN